MVVTTLSNAVASMQNRVEQLSSSAFRIRNCLTSLKVRIPFSEGGVRVLFVQIMVTETLQAFVTMLLGHLGSAKPVE